jgi:hypothetical protein
MDAFGDHAFCCKHFTTFRTAGLHDLIQRPFRFMGRLAFGPNSVWKDDTRPRAHSLVYSPLYRPDTTFAHASHTGNHLVGDITCPSVVAAGTVQAAAREPGAAAAAAAAGKRQDYGDLGAHELLPLVVEAEGAWGKEALKFFSECKRRVALDDYDEAGLPAAHHSWTTNNFTNYFLADVSVQRIRGVAYLLRTAASILYFTPGVLPPAAGDDLNDDLNFDFQDYDLQG